MHRGHDHDHHHHGGAAHHHPGHNSGPSAVQWQVLHDEAHHHDHEHGDAPPDLDLVEKAFVDAFPAAPDATSFLRLAGVPFAGEDSAGRHLSLLRVEIGHTTDVGTLAPGLGGGHRYAPLPAQLASRRHSLSLVYFDGTTRVSLSLAEARGLKDLTPPR